MQLRARAATAEARAGTDILGEGAEKDSAVSRIRGEEGPQLAPEF